MNRVATIRDGLLMLNIRARASIKEQGFPSVLLLLLMEELPERRIHSRSRKSRLYVVPPVSPTPSSPPPPPPPPWKFPPLRPKPGGQCRNMRMSESPQ